MAAPEAPGLWRLMERRRSFTMTLNQFVVLLLHIGQGLLLVVFSFSLCYLSRVWDVVCVFLKTRPG